MRAVEGFFAIMGINRHRLLHNHRAAIHLYIRHKMHHDARLLDLTALKGGKSFANGIGARKLTRQRWVQIDHPVGKMF